ncbi:effector binding domain-containing protein [Paenibacillus sp. GXUN7292]|uniref:effector binding domain-containing protein n=1 Tax=Paenibacillus sp. GXUN7292 TaxID=3422499 RepID=UPI003D7E2A34
MEAQLIRNAAFTAAVRKAAGSMKNFELGKEVRRVWHEVIAAIEQEGLEWNEKDVGYVFIPQWVTEPIDELELLVGVKIDSTDRTPAGLQILKVPARTYVSVPARGDRDQIMRAYAFIEEWIGREGYIKVTEEGVYGMEPNRLTPENPFDIPADRINRFDFDIMIAIKE